MPQAGDTYDWVGVDDSGNPVTQKMMWNADMLSTNPDTGEQTQGGWVPYIAPYSQTTNQDTGQVSYYLPGQGYTTSENMSDAQLSAAGLLPNPDPTAPWSGLLSNPTTPGFASAYDSYLNQYLQKFFPDATRNEVKKAIVNAGLASFGKYGEDGPVISGQGSGSNPYAAAYQTVLNLYSGRGGDPNVFQRVVPVNQEVSDRAAQAAVDASPEGIARAQAASEGNLGGLGSLAGGALGALLAPETGGLSLALGAGLGSAAGSYADYGNAQQALKTGLLSGATAGALGALGGAAEAVDPEMLQAYKDAGLLAQDATDFSALSQPMAYTPDGGVIRASDLGAYQGLGASGGAGADGVTWTVSDSTMPSEQSAVETTATPVLDTSAPTNPWADWEATQGTPGGSFPSAVDTGGLNSFDTGAMQNIINNIPSTPPSFWDRLTSIQSLSDVGDLIKEYPKSAGAILGFLKGGLPGAAAGAILGSGIEDLAAEKYLPGALQTFGGLAGLALTGNQGLLGGPLGKVFGGTAAPGAGGAGAGGAGAGGAGLPGMIRPYSVARVNKTGPNGQPYIDYEYTPQTPYYAQLGQPLFKGAAGGQIPDLDNMYPQSSIDRSFYATPLQRPVQQAVVSSGYGPKLNPFTGEEQMAGGGLADLTPTYAAGGRLLRGPGDGVSDSIPAVIGGKRPQRAALADGEFVLPARIVSEIGNGSTEAGARKLYAMMDRIQKRRGSTLKNVAADTRAEKLLPA